MESWFAFSTVCNFAARATEDTRGAQFPWWRVWFVIHDFCRRKTGRSVCGKDEKCDELFYLSFFLLGCVKRMWQKGKEDGVCLLLTENYLPYIPTGL